MTQNQLTFYHITFQVNLLHIVNCIYDIKYNNKINNIIKQLKEDLCVAKKCCIPNTCSVMTEKPMISCCTCKVKTLCRDFPTIEIQY